MFRPDSKWQWALLGVVIVELIVVLGMEGWALYAFENGLDWGKVNLGEQAPFAEDNKDDFGMTIRNYVPYARSFPTFLALFIFGMIYMFGLCWDALRLKNTIQIIGICIFNWILCLYGILQEVQIADVVKHLKQVLKAEAVGTGQGDGSWLEEQMRKTTIAVPVVLGVGSAIVSFIGWKLYHEFAWTIYKHVSADLQLRRRYMIFEIYIAILKFDFFFFLSFTMEFLVLLSNTLHDPEFWVTIVAVPVTILILIAAAAFVRRENKPCQILVLIFYVIGLAYFLFKLIRIWDPSSEVRETYAPAAKPLTVLAVITIIMICATIIVGIMCMRNFGKGLKPYVNKRGKHEEIEEGENKFSMDTMANPNHPTTGNFANQPGRMVIE